ncbi:esterase-like activity of phytase family protein [Acinetobacter sp. WZC-1]|uniref:esterase-like activity of phytase family protein n=1 Tax=Acinetobacter sp. WZC-1 TaxID=3459034 RepID=UPI00403D898D
MKKAALMAALLGTSLITACSDGDNGQDGLNSLINQTALTLGNDECWTAGTRMDSGLDKNKNGLLDPDEIQQSTAQCGPNLFAQGAVLPYTILARYSANGSTIDSDFEIHHGGFGSDVAAHPTNKKQFYAMTDRGPNADYDDGVHGAGKIFPVPDYTPEIGLFEVQDNGTVQLIKTIRLKDRDGKAISGLPNTAALGGTGETPYDVNGQVITVDATRPYDPVNNPVKLDDYGLDSEGLAAMNDGTFWVSDEYGPHIVHYDADGKEIGRINPFTADQRNTFNLPNEFSYRRANRGMEGLTVTPDQKTLVGIMQSTMNLPDKTVNKSTLTRIVTINLETGKIGQYLYRQEINENSNSAIVALSDKQFLVLERDGLFLRDTPNIMKHVYRIDLSEATDLESITAQGDMQQDDKLGLTIAGKTLEQYVLDKGWEGLQALNIQPVSKSLVLDVGKRLNYPHDKMEGLWLIDNQHLGLVNDDDFGLWSNKKGMEQKYLDTGRKRMDASTLYIVDQLNLSGK